MLIYKHWFWFFFKEKKFPTVTTTTNKQIIHMDMVSGRRGEFFSNEWVFEREIMVKTMWLRQEYELWCLQRWMCVCMWFKLYMKTNVCMCICEQIRGRERERRDCLQWNFLQIGWLGKFNFCFEYQFSVCSNWP